MKKYIDITNDMINYAIPNSHKVEELHYFIDKNLNIHIVDGHNIVLDYSWKEYEIALLLESIFGGEIYMLPRINKPWNIKTPDFLWNNEYWDLKEISTSGKRVIDNRINNTKNQTNNYIIDCSNNKMNNKELIQQIKKNIQLT